MGSSEETNSLHPLYCQFCEIDDDCIGESWLPADEDRLASLIAIIAMGQAEQAAHIIKEFEPALPAFSIAELRHEAIIKLTVQEEKQNPRIGYPRTQRDGLVFEIISWIAARQIYGKNTYMKSPHVSATSQGLDGLIIELSDDYSQIVKTTILEDKCTDNPRATFLNQVIPAFAARHRNERSAELVSAASALLREAEITGHVAAKMSAVVTDRNTRHYRAAFALPDSYHNKEQRIKLFKDYNKVEDIDQKQRVASSLITSANMREWMDNMANRSILYLNALQDW